VRHVPVDKRNSVKSRAVESLLNVPVIIAQHPWTHQGKCNVIQRLMQDSHMGSSSRSIEFGEVTDCSSDVQGSLSVMMMMRLKRMREGVASETAEQGGACTLLPLGRLVS
jgi:hypothetical protein